MNELLTHDAQETACKEIAGFIQTLRQARSDVDYFEIQVELFRRILKAQQSLQEASRNRAREEKGKTVPPSALATWADDQRLWNRIQRQYRAVGDAMAWSRVGFDRRYILAYSRNADPGPFAPKTEGFPAELRTVEKIWKEQREFALLHDLTNCLRIGDLTVFARQGAYVGEVKSSGRKPPAAQMKRMQEALAFLSRGAPLRDEHGEMWEVISHAQFKARFKDLARALALADKETATSVFLSRGWVLDCVVGAHQHPLDGRSKETKYEAFQERKQRVYARAGLDKTLHLLKVRALGDLAVSPALAPPTIFPLDPWMCALLTCDLAAYLSVMDWEVLAEAFRSEGFKVLGCPLPASSDTMAATDPVLVAAYGRGRLQIEARVYSQMAIELVEPRRYAQAMREAVERGTPGRGVLTFANERAVWR